MQTVLQSAIGLSLTQEGECGLECKEKLSEEDEGWGCRVALIQASAFGAGASLGGGLGGAREVRGERLGGKACCSGESISWALYGKCRACLGANTFMQPVMNRRDWL